MPVIAMTREMGSGGREVAQGVCERLGLTLILHEMVEHDLAERLQLPESTIHRRLEGGASLRERWQIGSSRLAQYTAEEVLELAHKGNALIRGWGACVLLRDVAHVMRVRVCAPIELRRRSVMQRRRLEDAPAAQREIERNDDAHRRTLRAQFGADREEALHYDLVLNTERLSIRSCVRLVCDLAESGEFEETEASRAMLADQVLGAHIRIKLDERFTAGTGASGLEATVEGGRVVLRGTVIHSTLAAEAASIVRALPGVKAVDNRIEIAHGPRGL